MPAAGRSRTRGHRWRTRFGTESQQRGRSARIGDDVPDIAGPGPADHFRCRTAGDRGQFRGQLTDGVRLTGTHVDGLAVPRPSAACSARALIRATSETCTKSRRCRPSSITRGASSALQRRPEDRRHARVGRVARHPRPVDVVVAQRPDTTAGLARPRRGRCSCASLVAAYVLRGSIGASSGTSSGASGWPQTGQGGSNRPASRSRARRGAARTTPCSAQR